MIYYIDDEQTPYLVKIPLSSSQVTLRDFKTVLNKQSCNYKYFFKSVDADFGVVKEEIVDESTVLPVFNGRVISWLVTADGSNQSDNCSEIPHSEIDSRIGGSGGGGSGSGGNREQGNGLGHMQTTRKPMSLGATATNINTTNAFHHMNIPPNPLTYQSASVMSSDLDATSLFETESEITLDRDMTECSSVHRLQVRKKPQRRKKRAPSMSRTSSYSSITDSTMSLNIITVSINMEAVNFLGISIVGQSNRGGDGGIYVGSIMKGGAVALDGRIEPGDMILQVCIQLLRNDNSPPKHNSIYLFYLQVNDVNFENMTNDEAVRVLREVVQKPGPIKLVVAKCWDPNPKGYFTIPRTEPVRPIDPGAWVAHTQAVTAQDPHGCQDVGSIPGNMHGIGIGSISSTISNQLQNPTLMIQERLNRNNLEEIVKAMTKPDSGLDIRDRMWLKIVIPNAFIGSDAVNWVNTNVDGISDRRDARRVVSSMLRSNLIKHVVNKLNFSEQCYYVLSDGSQQSE